MRVYANTFVALTALRFQSACFGEELVDCRAESQRHNIAGGISVLCDALCGPVRSQLY